MTAQTTIEALIFELRDGVGALAEDGARSRLARCSKAAMRQVVKRLRPGQGGRYDPNWNAADIQTLMLEWQKLQGRH